MDGSFHGPDHHSVQDRWSGLANRLEAALENRAYRTALCLATVILIVGYACIASRLAEPPRWSDSRLVHIDESNLGKSRLSPRDVDAVNRSIVRLEKLANVLALKPQRLNLRLNESIARSPFAIENHILRLWIDEDRGFYSGGMYEMTSEAIARAVLAIVFPTGIQGEKSLAGLPAESDGWYGQVKSLRETCFGRKSISIGGGWGGLCEALGNTKSAQAMDLPSPLSLSPWLTRQIISESDLMSPGQRIAYLRRLIHASSDTKLLEFERANRWPTEAKEFGLLLKEIVSTVAPERSHDLDFNAVVPFLQAKLGARGAESPESLTKGLHVELLVVTSCNVPRLVDFKGFEAHEVLWARVCPKSLSALTSLVPANNGEEFAAKNPDVSFALLGVQEISYALKKGWINSKTDITDFVVSARDTKSRAVAYEIRPQSEEWNAKAQAFRVKAPIEVLKLMRLRRI